MKFLIALLILASLGAGSRYVYENATVTTCHDKKFLWIKTGEECVTERKYHWFD